MLQRPAPPVDAATVILARPALTPGFAWECYMIRRPVGSDFAANVYVFPGGKVDPADFDQELAQVCRGHPGIGSDTNARHDAWRALRIAAIRELFEEVGVLVAENDGRVIPLEGAEAVRFSRHRQNVHSAQLDMRRLAEEENLLYPLNRLYAIARWVTPEPFPRRFDTTFFVTEMPEGQTPQPHFHETSEGLWISPAQALERFHAGTFPLVFATERNLQRLAEHGSVESLIASAPNACLDPVTPRMIVDQGDTRFLLPGDEGYE